MKPILLTVFLLLSLTLNAQTSNKFQVSAVAVDSTGTAEMFVTYRIFAETDSVRPVAGAVTGDDGVVNAPLPAAGAYRITLVGMATETVERRFSVDDACPVADLGSITLAAAKEELSEITVTAQRPLVTKEIDRINYDVQSDEDAKTSPLLDILRKVPMVSVDADGNIKVNGSSDFKIYKNGRPNNSFSKNAKDIFQAIPASTIKRVEVITDPGAREDAEGVGAILNIVTNSDTGLNGVLGNVSLYADTNNAIPVPNLWLSSQLGKVVFSVSGGYYNSNRRETESSQHTDANYMTTGDRLLMYVSSVSPQNGGWGDFELSYELDSLNLFNAECNFYMDNSSPESDRLYQMYDSEGSLLYKYAQTSRYRQSRYLDIDGNFSYQRSTRRKGETLTLSYRVSTTNQKQASTDEYTSIYNFVNPYSGINSDFDLNFIEHTFQFDWSRPLTEKQKLDVGGKAILRRNHSKNSREYIGYDSTFDDFSHNTDIAAVYADYRISLGKWSLRAGLRYEYSHLAAKFHTGESPDFGSSLNDFAPNAAASYNINDENTLKASYSRRISRPGIWYLDPTVSESPLSTSSGNPYLKSSNTDSYNINYSLIKSKFNLDATLSYRYSGDEIRETIDVEGSHNYYSYGNVGRRKDFRINAYCQWSPTDKTSLVFNGGLAWGQAKNAESGATLSHWTPNGYLQVQQRLPWKLRLTGWCNYWCYGLQSELSYSENTGADGLRYGFRLQRSWLKDDALTASVNISRPFGPYRYHSITHNINSDYLATTDYVGSRSFCVGFRVAYRFGSLKASVKKTASSIDNDDLSGRKMQ